MLLLLLIGGPGSSGRGFLVAVLFICERLLPDEVAE